MHKGKQGNGIGDAQRRCRQSAAEEESGRGRAAPYVGADPRVCPPPSRTHSKSTPSRTHLKSTPSRTHSKPPARRARNNGQTRGSAPTGCCRGLCGSFP